VLDESRRTAGPRQVSSFLSEAAKEKLQRSRILTYLDELDATHGPPDSKARTTASRRIRRILG
jgi:hypothetical protein